MIRINNPDRTPGYVMPQSSLSVIEAGLNDVLSKVPEHDRGKAEKYLQSFVDSHQNLATYRDDAIKAREEFKPRFEASFYAGQYAGPEVIEELRVHTIKAMIRSMVTTNTEGLFFMEEVKSDLQFHKMFIIKTSF